MEHPTCMRCEQDRHAICTGYPYCHGYMNGCQCGICIEREAVAAKLNRGSLP